MRSGKGIDQITGRGVESCDIFAAVEDIQAVVEAALQAVDYSPVETLKMRLVECLIEPILSFDHEVQAPFAVVNVESQQELHPTRNLL